MRLAIHAPDDLLNPELQAHTRAKLLRTLQRFAVEEDAHTVIDVVPDGDGVQVRVRAVLVAHANPLVVNATAEDAGLAMDAALDRLSRQLRDMEARRRASRRKAALSEAAEVDTEDFFTEGEEDVLREMGALDAVLGL